MRSWPRTDLVIVPDGFLSAGTGPVRDSVHVGDVAHPGRPRHRSSPSAHGRRSRRRARPRAERRDGERRAACRPSSTGPPRHASMSKSHRAGRPDDVAESLQGALVAYGVKADTFQRAGRRPSEQRDAVHRVARRLPLARPADRDRGTRRRHGPGRARTTARDRDAPGHRLPGTSGAPGVPRGGVVHRGAGHRDRWRARPGHRVRGPVELVDVRRSGAAVHGSPGWRWPSSAWVCSGCRCWRSPRRPRRPAASNRPWRSGLRIDDVSGSNSGDQRGPRRPVSIQHSSRGAGSCVVATSARCGSTGSAPRTCTRHRG